MVKKWQEERITIPRGECNPRPANPWEFVEMMARSFCLAALLTSFDGMVPMMTDSVSQW
jgi:hypothetical protein